MKPTDLPLLVQRLNGPMEALGALGAVLRIQAEGLAVDPGVRDALAGVLRALGVDEAELAATPKEQKLAIAGGIRAFLRHSVELVEQPDRLPGWSIEDPTLLQNQGRMSAPIAPLIEQIAPSLGDLAERLRGANATFLDVGTGVAWLAIAMATTFPGLCVVGLDVFAPALALARANIAQAGLADRVVVREQSVLDMTDRDAFDLAFVAGPFLPKAIVPDALARTRDALRPGGFALFAMFATIDDPLPLSTQALRVVRSGGHAWDLAEVRELLDAAGLRDARVLERTWPGPVAFVAGRK